MADSGDHGNEAIPLLLAMAARCSGGRAQRTSLDEKQLAEEVAALFSTPDTTREPLLNTLFPGGLPRDASYFDRLYDLRMSFPFGPLGDQTVGAILSATVHHLSAEVAEPLLMQFTLVEGSSFFFLLDSLAVPAEDGLIHPAFAAKWFPSLLRRIGNDLANIGFWRALDAYCEKCPESALEMLSVLCLPSDEFEIAVACTTLGALRAISSTNAYVSQHLEQWNEMFRRSTDSRARAVYFRSWVRTFSAGNMNDADHMAALLEEIPVSTPAEKEQSVWLVCRLLSCSSLPSDVVDLGLNWLRPHATPAASPSDKYHLTELAVRLARKLRFEGKELVLEVQPFGLDQEGTWGQLEALLVILLKQGNPVFSDFFVALAGRSAEQLCSAFQQRHQGFDHLLSEMKKCGSTDLVTMFVVSRSGSLRQLGLLLFERLQLESLPGADKLTEEQLRIALYGMQCFQLQAEAVAAFLAAVASCTSRTSPEFQRELKDELILQGKSFRASCSEGLRSRADANPILKEALAEVDIYFATIRGIRTSSLSAIEVPGYRHAMRAHLKRTAAAIKKGTDDYSVFLKLVKKVHLLYGKSFASFNEGRLGNPTGLNTISTTVEIPRLEFLDPEGMFLRRHAAQARLAELTGENCCVEGDL